LVDFDQTHENILSVVVGIDLDGNLVSEESKPGNLFPKNASVLVRERLLLFLELVVACLVVERLQLSERGHLHLEVGGFETAQHLNSWNLEDEILVFLFKTQ